MTVLSNVDIEKKIKTRGILANYKKDNIGPCCYELRMGDVYYDLTESNKRIELSYNQDVIIKPGHLVVLITAEDVNIPNDMTARVISKGSLFSIGLTPVCTNVDPGFDGKMGIVTQNISNKYIAIPKNEALAKIDFSMLSCETTKPYKGQHGFQTQVWPIKEHFQKTYNEIKSDPRVESEIKEASKIIPKSTANMINRMIKYQKRTNVSLIILLIVNIGVMAALQQDWFNVYVSFGISIIAGIITTLYVNNISEVNDNGH